MDFDGSILDELKCASQDKPEHFIEEPKLLSCGHSICSKCIQIHNEHKITCNKCKQVNELDLKKQSVSKLVQALIKTNLNELSKATHDKLTKTTGFLQTEITELNVRIENQFKFIQDVIEVHVESLKSKLDDICNNFKIQLNESKQKMKNHIIGSFNATNVEEQLKKFEECINSNDINELKFFEFNTKCADLCEQLLNVKEFDYKVNFEINEAFTIENNSVCSFNCKYEAIQNKLSNGKCDFIQLDHQPSDVLELKDKNILISSLDDNCLVLYDRHFNFLRRIDFINNMEIKPLGLAYDYSSENIYMTNFYDKSIYMLDSYFNLIAKFQHSSEEIYHNDICVYANKLYACSSKTKSIEIFQLDLQLVSTNYLSEVAYQIRIADDVACVQHDSTTAFYKLPFFDKLFDYRHIGPIVAYDKWFCVYNRCFSVYSYKGKWLKKILINDHHWNLKYVDANMEIIDNFLYVCLAGKRLGKMNI